MKSYTDIEQSKNLAEILPLESADMHYENMSVNDGMYYIDKHRPGFMKYSKAIKVLSQYTKHPLFEVIPCWSLAALLDALPEGIIEDYYAPFMQKEDNIYSIAYGNDILLCEADNPVDACYKLIVKLKELNLL